MISFKLTLSTAWLVLMLAATTSPAAAPPETKIFIVRHAEKAGTAGDVELSPAGVRRAEALARLLRPEGLAAVFATATRRSHATATPVAALSGLEVTPYPPQPSAEWFQDLLARHRGRKVLIVGHSNTIPQIAEALGAPENVVWGDDEYDRLLEITITENGAARLSERRYGPIAGGP